MSTEAFLQIQLSLTTADEERQLGLQSLPSLTVFDPRAPELPPGEYRVIDGQLFRIVPGVPPAVRDKNGF